MTEPFEPDNSAKSIGLIGQEITIQLQPVDGNEDIEYGDSTTHVNNSEIMTRVTPADMNDIGESLIRMRVELNLFR